MGVRYQFRKRCLFDGMTMPSNIQTELKNYFVEGIAILEYRRPCVHYINMKPIESVYVFEVIIASKEKEIVFDIEKRLISSLISDVIPASTTQQLPFFIRSNPSLK